MSDNQNNYSGNNQYPQYEQPQLEQPQSAPPICMTPNTIPSAVPSTVPNTVPSTVPNTVPSLVPNTAPNTIPDSTPNTAPGAAQEEEDPKVNSANKKGIWSIVLAVISPCCCYISPIIGFILGVTGLMQNKKSIVCIIGTALCSLLLAWLLYKGIGILANLERIQLLAEQFMDIVEQIIHTVQQYVPE